MPSWGDFGSIWTTLRDVDVNAIREEAERPLLVAVVGHEAALATVSRLLSESEDRYPGAGVSPLLLLPPAEASGRGDQLRGASLLILALDGAAGVSPADTGALTQLDRLGVPSMVVILGGAPAPITSLPPNAAARSLVLPDPSALDAADRLAADVLRLLPAELHMAAARRLPGLRAAHARELIGNASFSNASYALASGLPEQIPLIGVPFAAADMIVLTKNQAMLTYRIALAYGAPPGFQERIAEVIPVIGSGFLWRQLARSLIGLIPVWGLVPKVAVAYAGTYTTGVAAWRWFERGELVSTDQLKRISAEAMRIGRARAEEIVRRAKATGDRLPGRGLRAAIGERLPFRRKRLPTSTQAADE